MGNATLDGLKARIASGDACVGILGLGYVGLPLAVEFGAAGLSVMGFDLSEGKVASLNRGESYIQDVESARLKALVDKGKVKAKGWKCRMKVGYEYFQAKCKRKKMKFKAESAA